MSPYVSVVSTTENAKPEYCPPFRVPVVTFHHAEAQLEEIRDAIRRRAYEIFETRRDQDGNALTDWLKAEAEILQPVRYGLEELDDHLRVNIEVTDLSASQMHLAIGPTQLLLAGAAESIKCEPVESGLDCRAVERKAILEVNLPIRVDSDRATALANCAGVTVSIPILAPQS